MLEVESSKLKDLEITIDKAGANRFSKVSYPIRYGRFSEIETPKYRFQFNLNGEIKYIQGHNGNWPHPAEWLKRTDANDWVFYAIGGYHGILSLLGEYYLPCFAYPNNSIWKYDPFAETDIQRALAAWSDFQNGVRGTLSDGVSCKAKNFLDLISRHDNARLRMKSEMLHRIIGDHVSVLPPDTRHVDYEVIPLIIADGCLYHCDFCCFKARPGFHPRSKEDIRQQVRQLKAFYGPDLRNHSALFLGNHDALAAGGERIYMAATESYTAFGFETAYVQNPVLFLFGSVDSLLRTDIGLIEALNSIPMYTYINIGFESADSATLARINKPLDIRKIEDAFKMMLEINRSYANIEITGNFLLGDRLPPEHYSSLVELVRNGLDRYYSKGAIYLSPLKGSRDNREMLNIFAKIKNLSRLPSYIYLIQRL
jgi:hypothetical protein